MRLQLAVARLYALNAANSRLNCRLSLPGAAGHMHYAIGGALLGQSRAASSAPLAPANSTMMVTAAPQARQTPRPVAAQPAAAAAASTAAAGRRRGCTQLHRQPAAQAARLSIIAAAAAGPEAAQPADAGPPSQQGEEQQWVEVGCIGPPHGVRGEFKVQPLTDFPEERLSTPGARWVQAPAPKIGRRQAPEPEEVELEWGRMMLSKGREVWLVKLEGIESPEEAAELRGHMLLVPAGGREPLEDEDEFYVQDLVGLQVFLQATGEEVGRVSDVFDGTGTHDLLRIKLAPAQLERLAALAAAEEAAEEAAASSGASSSGGESEAGDEEADGDAAAPGVSGGSRHVLLPFAKAMVPVVDLKAGRMEITPPEGLLELAAPTNLRRQRRENRGRRERRRERPRGKAGKGASLEAAPPPQHSDVE